MRFFLDAIFDPEHQAALSRFADRHKSNDDEGRQMRAASIRANHELGYGDRGILGDHRLTFRVKAGREVVSPC